MTLSIGLDIARSALSTSAERTSVIARNVANAGEPNATRKNANVVTLNGGSRIASVTHAANEALFRTKINANSTASRDQAIAQALDRLEQTVNDPELGLSPAAVVGKLTEAIQLYAAAPQDPIRAQNAVSAAGDVVRTLADTARTIQQVRHDADGEIALSVDRLNSLLVQFGELNDAIVKGTQSGADVTDQLDQRDTILTTISAEIGIRKLVRANNDIAIFTESGVTLFEKSARTVSFDIGSSSVAGVAGNPVYIDGVPVTGGGAGMAVVSGRIIGLATVRDEIATTYQSQLDEIARGLIEVFRESDQGSPPTGPDLPGLFTYSGAPALPASGVIIAGLAGDIKLNPNVDPAVGGEPSRLRDGGISDPANPAYLYNTTGAAGFSTRLEELVDQLSEKRSFDPQSGSDTDASVAEFASSSIAWLEENRKSAADSVEFRTAFFERSSQALANETGVNLDEEMAVLLELERSYQASSRLITTIDNMFGALLAAVN